jgi:Flp pilus assembly protein TadB
VSILHAVWRVGVIVCAVTGAGCWLAFAAMFARVVASERRQRRRDRHAAELGEMLGRGPGDYGRQR